jgi:hypothetical protein
MKITVIKLPTDWWHIRGTGPYDWAQVPFWPCDRECIKRNAWPAASEEFIDSAAKTAMAKYNEI